MTDDPRIELHEQLEAVMDDLNPTAGDCLSVLVTLSAETLAWASDYEKTNTLAVKEFVYHLTRLFHEICEAQDDGTDDSCAEHEEKPANINIH